MIGQPLPVPLRDRPPSPAASRINPMQQVAIFSRSRTGAILLPLLIIPSSFTVKDLRQLPCARHRAKVANLWRGEGGNLRMLKAALLFVSAMLIPKAHLAVENLALRQQLVVS